MNKQPDHISVSQARMWLKCQQQWYFKYIEGIKGKPSVRCALGIGVHAGLAQANIFRQAHVDVDMDTVLDTMNSELVSQFTNNEYTFDELRDEKDTIARAERILRVATLKMPVYTGQPMFVEYSIEDKIAFGDIKLAGFIDLVDDMGTIYDFKVGGRPKSQSDADHDLQLALYAYAMNKDNDTDAIATQLVSVDNKSGTIAAVATWKTRKDMLAAYSTLDRISKQIGGVCESGAFIPNTENWCCSPKYCDWYQSCEYGGKE